MQRRRRRQREQQKTQWAQISKTIILHVYHAFLYISQPSLYDFNVKMPYFSFFRGREHKTTFFSFPELYYSLLEFNSRIRIRTKRDGISAIKFEATRPPFLSDFFVSVRVAIVVAFKLPNNATDTLLTNSGCPILAKFSENGSFINSFFFSIGIRTRN